MSPCPAVWCGAVVESGYCDKHKRAETAPERDYDARRGNSSSRGYTSYWARWRRWYLRQPEHGMCAIHELDPTLTCNDIATEVHHIVKVRDDRARMFDARNVTGPM
jgi:hypothetical protein